MIFDLYIVSLLVAFEEYLRYMTDEELAVLLYYGEWPTARKIAEWELRKMSREALLRKRFNTAYERQKRAENRRKTAGAFLDAM